MDEEDIKVETSDPLEKNVIYDRYKFHQRVQRSEETLNNFLQDIRKLSENCEFHNDERELLLRDRFVCGLNDKDLQLTIVSNGGNPTIQQIYQRYITCQNEIDSVKTEEENVNAHIPSGKCPSNSNDKAAESDISIDLNEVTNETPTDDKGVMFLLYLDI